MKMNNSNQELSIKCGKTTNSFEELKLLCKKEADKLLKTIDVSSQSTISVAFWTVDIPELICIGNFSKEKDGGVRYDLDFSQTTLQFCFDSQGLKVAIFFAESKKMATFVSAKSYLTA